MYLMPSHSDIPNIAARISLIVSFIMHLQRFVLVLRNIRPEVSLNLASGRFSRLNAESKQKNRPDVISYG